MVAESHTKNIGRRYDMPKKKMKTIVIDDSTYEIDGKRFIVERHFKENGETAEQKLLKLIKRDVEEQNRQSLMNCK